MSKLLHFGRVVKKVFLFRFFLGFTLMELMIVVVIISVLVALAVPNYVATREKALDREALSTLRLIKVANKQYFSKFEGYYPFSGTSGSLAAINSNLSLALNGTNWVFNMSGTGGTFTANATRGGRTWTITNAADPSCSGSCL